MITLFVGGNMVERKDTNERLTKTVIVRLTPEEHKSFSEICERNAFSSAGVIRKLLQIWVQEMGNDDWTKRIQL